MALTPGLRLGPYEIAAAIGAGGMGEVYRARDTRLDRTVAIKILPMDFASDPAARERFDREARAISQLDHPNVCALYDVGTHEGTAYLVMQYLEGETLAARLERGPLPIEEAIRLAAQIADALVKAHQHGIVHRDLKPGNVMLVRTGSGSAPPTAKLLDFGLAKPTSVADAATMTATAPPVTAAGTILGTFQYMAPEQIEGRDVDARADLWALGCVLYEMVAGRKAFAGQSSASTMAAVLEREPQPLSTVRPLAPVALDRIVRKCLAKDRDARWQTARDLADELRWVAEQPVASAIGAPTQRKRLPWVLLAIAGVAILAVGLLLWQSRAMPPATPSVYRFQISTPPMLEQADFEISPDGKTLAFVALTDAKMPAVWIRPLGASNATPVGGSEGARGVFWSPDSQSIGYASSRQLHTQSLAGGQPRLITNFIGQFMGGAWTGDTIVYSTFPSGLMRVSAGGGQPTLLTQLRSGDLLHRKPTFFADGRRFLFSPARFSGIEICAASLDDDALRCVNSSGPLVSYVNDRQLLSLRDNVLVVQPIDPASQQEVGSPIAVLDDAIYVTPSFRRIAISVSPTGVIAFRSGTTEQRELVWFDRAGQQQDIIATGTFQNFDLGPDGGRILASGYDQNGNQVLSLIDSGRSVTSRVVPADVGWANDPVWSPDGREFAYTQRVNRSRIAVRPVAGGAERVVYEPPDTDVWVEDWSKDGRYLVVGTAQAWQQPRVFLVPLAGGTPITVPVEEGIVDEYHFSPDGRWLAYNSNASGRHEIWVTPLPPTGERWQVSSAGGVQARWRGDGRELFYIAPDGALMVVSIEAGPVFKASAPRELFQLPIGLGSPILDEYAVSRDGQRFLVARLNRSSETQPINIVVNWPQLLERRK